MAEPNPSFLGPIHSNLSDASVDGYQASSTPRMVILGASAGGLEAIEQFMQACDQLNDQDLAPWAIIIIQHLSPDHHSIMDSLLQRCCRMPISYASADAPINGGNCYLIPAHADISCDQGRFALHARPSRSQRHHPIDRFACSLDPRAAKGAVLIIASGSGSDGAVGAQHIAEHHGQVWIQIPEESRFPQMPEASLEQVPHAHKASMPHMAAMIFSDCSQEPSVAINNETEPPSTTLPSQDPPDPLKILANLLSEEHHVQWDHYNETTLMRRLDQGRQRRQLKSIDDYVQYCIDHADERPVLVRELLVHVTSFFRDPDCFAALKTQVQRQLKDLSPEHPEYRVWVVGCASGEEAYTVAMVIAEAQHEAGTTHKLRIWATDLHPDSIRKASRGLYSLESLSPLGQERLNSHVLLEHRHGSFVPSIRNSIVFAPHDVLSDPPFLHIDLLCCRNLLIYFREKTRQALLKRFCTSLSNNGIMMLGRSENLACENFPLAIIDQRHRLYRKTEATNYQPLQEDTLSLRFHPTPLRSQSYDQSPEASMPLLTKAENKTASSAKSVGGFWLRQSPKCMK